MVHDGVHSGGQNGDARTAPQPISVQLRQARQRLGVELRDVAETLRIRHVFLLAIEEGRYADLPGTAYASGFLRSYAEFLGLDADTIVRRYKDEVAGRPGRMEIYLPTPVPEGRVPGGALLLAALVIAGGVYGVWYYLSATDRSMVDLVPALPERLVALLDTRSLPTPPPEKPPAPAPASGGTATVPVPAAPASPPPAAAPGATAAPATATPPVVAAPAAAPAAAAHPPATATPGAKPPAANGAAKPAASPAVPAAAPEEDEADMATQEPTPLAASGAPAPTSPPPPVVVAAAELGPPARTFGSQNATVRLQIRASQESWLQIRDGGSEIFTRVLKPGDVYRVPDNKTGLKLRTGNAGGLFPIIDGVPGPALGSAGQVMRDVPVDSLAGKAAPR